MTPYKSKKSFKTRLVIAISIVNLAVILAITYLTYRWNAQQLQEQTIAQTQQTIEQAGTNVSTYMDELYRLTLTPYYNDEVLSQLVLIKFSVDVAVLFDGWLASLVQFHHCLRIIMLG